MFRQILLSRKLSAVLIRFRPCGLADNWKFSKKTESTRTPEKENAKQGKNKLYKYCLRQMQHSCCPRLEISCCVGFHLSTSFSLLSSSHVHSHNHEWYTTLLFRFVGFAHSTTHSCTNVRTLLSCTCSSIHLFCLIEAPPVERNRTENKVYSRFRSNLNSRSPFTHISTCLCRHKKSQFYKKKVCN